MHIGNRWPEIARTYAEVNQLFGDIIKVTPSSKVVGDMTMFLITRGLRRPTSSICRRALTSLSPSRICSRRTRSAVLRTGTGQGGRLLG